MIVTRKIYLEVIGTEEERKEQLEKLRFYQGVSHKVYNSVAKNMYLKELLLNKVANYEYE